MKSSFILTFLSITLLPCPSLASPSPSSLTSRAVYEKTNIRSQCPWYAEGRDDDGTIIVKEQHEMSDEYMVQSSTLQPPSDDSDYRLKMESFIWCPYNRYEGRIRLDEVKCNCEYPENAGRRHEVMHRADPAVLFTFDETVAREPEYLVEWSGASEEYPVKIEWLQRVSQGGGQMAVIWDMDLPAGPAGTSNWTFTPGGHVPHSFPNPLTPAIPVQVLTHAAEHDNYFRLSQPQHPAYMSDETETTDYYAHSQAWLLRDAKDKADWDIRNIREEEIRKEEHQEAKDVRKGFAVGMGIGLPTLTAVSALLSWWLTRRSWKREVRKVKAELGGEGGGYRSRNVKGQEVREKGFGELTPRTTTSTEGGR